MARFQIGVLVSLAALMAIQPLRLFIVGRGWGHDADVLVRFAAQVAAEGSGLWPPLWLSDAQGSFGSPAFSFYPPLLFSLAQALHFVVGVASHATSLALARLTILLLGIAGSTLVLFRLFGFRGATTGLLFFALAPYLSFINVNLRYAAAESAASGLMFLAASLAVAVAREAPFAAPMLALVTALILLTHVPSFVMTVILVGSFALFSRPARMLPRVGGAVILAAGLAAFHALPAAQLREAISLNLFMEPGHSHRGTMLFWGSLAVGQLSYVWYLLYAAFGALVITLSVLVVGQRCAIATDPTARGLAAATLTSLFFTTPLSIPLWDHLPILPLLQFPWRFLGAASVGCAVLAAALPRQDVAMRALAVQGALLAACFASLVAIVATDRWPHRTPQFLHGREMDRAVAGRELLRDPPEYIPATAQHAGWVSVIERDGRTVPIAREVVPSESLPRLHAGTGTVTYARTGPALFSISAACSSPCVVELPQFWFPGWAVSGTAPATVGPSEAGLVAISLPAGQSDVTLQMTRPSHAAIARDVSMLAFAGLLAWLGVAGLAHYRSRRAIGAPTGSVPTA